MSENNEAKAIGVQYKKLLTSKLTFTYNNFLGDEKVVPSLDKGKFNSRFRGYHNFIIHWLATDEWNLLGAMDFGHQAQQNNSGVDSWGSSDIHINVT